MLHLPSSHVQNKANINKEQGSQHFNPVRNAGCISDDLPRALKKKELLTTISREDEKKKKTTTTLIQWRREIYNLKTNILFNATGINFNYILCL